MHTSMQTYMQASIRYMHLVKMSIYQSICLPFYLSACLPVCLSVCLPVRLSVCPSVRLSVCPSVRLSVCPSVCLAVCLSVCLSVRLSALIRVATRNAATGCFVRVCYRVFSWRRVSFNRCSCSYFSQSFSLLHLVVRFRCLLLLLRHLVHLVHWSALCLSQFVRMWQA